MPPKRFWFNLFGACAIWSAVSMVYLRHHMGAAVLWWTSVAVGVLLGVALITWEDSHD